MNLVHSLARSKRKVEHKRRPSHFPATPYSQAPGRYDSSSSAIDIATRHDPFARTSHDLPTPTPFPQLASDHHPPPRPHPYNPGSQQQEQSQIPSLDRQLVDTATAHGPSLRRNPSRQSVQITRPLGLSVQPSSASIDDLYDWSAIDLNAPPSPIMSDFSHETHRPSPLGPNASPAESGYDGSTSAPNSAPRRTNRSIANIYNPSIVVEEADEEADRLGGLRRETSPVGAHFYHNNSRISLAAKGKAKADKILGLDNTSKLASLYLVSGMGKDSSNWSFADADATRGVQPLEDSLGLFWRPDVLGNTFSGEKLDEIPKERSRKDSKASNTSAATNPLSKTVAGKSLPDAGPEGPQRLVTKTMKYAHPRDIEIVNSTLSPPTTSHAFTFTIPRHDTLSAISRSKLDTNPYATGPRGTFDSSFNYDSVLTDIQGQTSTLGPRQQENLIRQAPELLFYGITLTVWTHADKERARTLHDIKKRAERSKRGLGSMNSTQTTLGATKRKPTPWTKHHNAEAEMTGSETDGMSDSDLEGPLGRRAFAGAAERLSQTGSFNEDVAAAHGETSDIFWMPYAVTMVSRYPIYDVMQDYLRLSWARYSKNAKAHMIQVNRILNRETPRPGEMYRLPVGLTTADTVTVEAHMPGALDFDKGLVKVDFQLWPLFQAVDVDHILTCAEVALSNSGRVIFCSRHPAMLNIAVSTLKYIVELRDWNGIAHPVIHARDSTLIIEDPGPYIIGIATECRYLLAPPEEVVILDIDTNSLTCKSPPAGIVTPHHKREKARHRIVAAFGEGYPTDRSVPTDLKVSYPKGSFRNINRFTWVGDRPHYLGERLREPSWWRHEAVMGAFDRILAEKHKKPSLFQRLTKSGLARSEAQLTMGEQLAKAMMRRRALHYVETRDDLELKVARINRRLIKLVQEGDHWKQQFETFEKYADRLANEANDLKIKIERERREARRLSTVANEQTKQNTVLQDQLRATETARSEAMRQLSDMHQSIQELEREREEIMNVIEAQITDALDGLPDTQSDRCSQPSTPGGSILSSPPSRRVHLRPGTKDSNRSQLSRFTVESQVSVLAAFRSNPIKRKTRSIRENDPLRAVDQSIDERSDSIADRVAIIQAKLEMALSTASTHQRQTSGSTDFDSIGDVDEDKTDQAASVRDIPSGDAELAIEDNATPRRVSPDLSDHQKPLQEDLIVEIPVSPLGEEYVSADEDGGGGGDSSFERKKKVNLLLDLSGGRQLKIRPKRKGSEESASSVGMDGATSMTSSTLDEILISPSGSKTSFESNKTNKPLGPGLKIRRKPSLERRISDLSSTTETFGHAE